jgi:hypothetical protein
MKPGVWARLFVVSLLCSGLAQATACSGRLPPSGRLHSGAAASATHRGPAVRLHEVDGGPGFYTKFSSSFRGGSSFFPIGVWLAAVNQESDITSDQAVGINTYVTLTDNSDFGLVGSSSMYLISNHPPTGGRRTAGWFVNDEADMWAGPGSAPWTHKYPGQGSICVPASAACGYTVQQSILKNLPNDGRLRYSNYGKGVAFWETDTQAARFVREYQDVVSDDNYWFTDDSICISSQGGGWVDPELPADGSLPARRCHLASNYGLTVARIRHLAGGRKPVWAYVELGHPSTEGDWPSIEPRQVAAAVWQSLIAGARGIIYFNHSFGGPCITDNVLRDSCYAKMRAAVTSLDKEIESLAPVLNAPFANGAVKTGPGVSISTKWYRGHFYILAGSSEPGAQTATFSMSCVGSADVMVLDEHRMIPATHGTFTDRFTDGNTVHIYRVDGGSTCGVQGRA